MNRRDFLSKSAILLTSVATSSLTGCSRNPLASDWYESTGYMEHLRRVNPSEVNSMERNIIIASLDPKLKKFSNYNMTSYDDSTQRDLALMTKAVLQIYAKRAVVPLISDDQTPEFLGNGIIEQKINLETRLKKDKTTMQDLANKYTAGLIDCKFYASVAAASYLKTNTKSGDRIELVSGIAVDSRGRMENHMWAQKDGVIIDAALYGSKDSIEYIPIVGVNIVQDFAPRPPVNFVKFYLFTKDINAHFAK